MQSPKDRVYRVLFLCTGNSGRSQIAETVLNWKGRGRFKAESAGSRPAAQVNPFAIQVLAESAIEWRGHQPRGLDGLDQVRWDFVITVCDKAREVCPVFPAIRSFRIGECPIQQPSKAMRRKAPGLQGSAHAHQPSDRSAPGAADRETGPSRPGSEDAGHR
jgi:protein-tyrosine-phosphatase